MDKMQAEVTEVLEAAGTAIVPQSMRESLITDLAPIANRIETYAMTAETIRVVDDASAKSAAEVCDLIAADVKAVKGHEILANVITGFHAMHRRLTALRDAFVAPMEASRKTIKGKVIAWTEAERAKAEAEQRRLQAIADEQARKERERLEAQAAKLKTQEKREERLEQAAQVIAPVVQVAAPKSAVKVARVWVARVVDAGAFFAAIATRPDLAGYCEISVTKLERAKASNHMTEIPGVEFRKEVR
jgi:hypothetical protein